MSENRPYRKIISIITLIIFTFTSISWSAPVSNDTLRATATAKSRSTDIAEQLKASPTGNLADYIKLGPREAISNLSNRYLARQLESFQEEVITVGKTIVITPTTLMKWAQDKELNGWPENIIAATGPFNEINAALVLVNDEGTEKLVLISIVGKDKIFYPFDIEDKIGFTRLVSERLESAQAGWPHYPYPPGVDKMLAFLKSGQLPVLKASPTGDIRKQLEGAVKVAKEKISEQLHVRKIRVDDAIPYEDIAKAISGNATDEKDTVRLIKKVTENITVLKEEKTTGYAMIFLKERPYEYGPPPSFNRTGWKFITEAEWNADLRSGVIAYKIASFDENDVSYSPSVYTSPWAIRRNVEFMQLSIGLSKPIKDIISAAKVKASPTGNVGITAIMRSTYDTKKHTGTIIIGNIKVTTGKKDELRRRQRKIDETKVGIAYYELAEKSLESAFFPEAIDELKTLQNSLCYGHRHSRNNFPEWIPGINDTIAKSFIVQTSKVPLAAGDVILRSGELLDFKEFLTPSLIKIYHPRIWGGVGGYEYIILAVDNDNNRLTPVHISAEAYGHSPHIAKPISQKSCQAIIKALPKGSVERAIWRAYAKQEKVAAKSSPTGTLPFSVAVDAKSIGVTSLDGKTKVFNKDITGEQQFKDGIGVLVGSASFLVTDFIAKPPLAATFSIETGELISFQTAKTSPTGLGTLKIEIGEKPIMVSLCKLDVPQATRHHLGKVRTILAAHHPDGIPSKTLEQQLKFFAGVTNIGAGPNGLSAAEVTLKGSNQTLVVLNKHDQRLPERFFALKASPTGKLTIESGIGDITVDTDALSELQNENQAVKKLTDELRERIASRLQTDKSNKYFENLWKNKVYREVFYSQGYGADDGAFRWIDLRIKAPKTKDVFVLLGRMLINTGVRKTSVEKLIAVVIGNKPKDIKIGIVTGLSNPSALTDFIYKEFHAPLTVKVSYDDWQRIIQEFHPTYAMPAIHGSDDRWEYRKYLMPLITDLTEPTKASPTGMLLDADDIASLTLENLEHDIALAKGDLLKVLTDSKLTAELLKLKGKGVIAIHTPDVPDSQRAEIIRMYDKDSPVLKELERLTGCIIRLTTQLEEADTKDKKLVIIAGKETAKNKLPGYEGAKYISPKNDIPYKTDNYLQLVPYIGVAKIILTVEGKDAIIEALNKNDFYHKIFGQNLTKEIVDNFLKTNIFELPVPKFDYKKVEMLQRIALIASIAA